jgi:Mg2+ and Co2+ transporter CorA
MELFRPQRIFKATKQGGLHGLWTKRVLITARFAPLSTFDAVAMRVKQDETIRSAPAVFTALLEAMVDRGADVLEFRR